MSRIKVVRYRSLLTHIIHVLLNNLPITGAYTHSNLFVCKSTQKVHLEARELVEEHMKAVCCQLTIDP